MILSISVRKLGPVRTASILDVKLGSAIDVGLVSSLLHLAHKTQHLNVVYIYKPSPTTASPSMTRRRNNIPCSLLHLTTENGYQSSSDSPNPKPDSPVSHNNKKASNVHFWTDKS